MDSGISLRRILLIVLVVATAAVTYRVGGDALARRAARDRADQRLAAASLDDAQDAAARDRDALLGRLDAYLAMRRADDWPALYELVDPVQREKVGLAAFLDAFGHKVLDIESIEATSVRLDSARGLAAVDLHTEALLVPERLPPAFQRGLRINSVDDLRRSTDHVQPWVRRGAEWYYKLDSEIVSGVDAQGRVVTEVGLPEG